jgi:LmbE family N-acetylglucosaminyl deacetylase
MRPHYDWIYLSPHLDDAALSCGGQIWQQTQAGQSVLIVSIMAGDPPAQISGYAQSLHDRWELIVDASAGRRAEDLAACAILGADALHWDVPDCIYRYDAQTGEPFYLSDPDIFGEIAPAERELVDDLVRQLRGLPVHDRLVVPLTLGHHVDHQLVRLAAEKRMTEQGADLSTLSYYEDYPYVQMPGVLDALIGRERGWRAEVIPLSLAALKAKIDAIAAFQSQLSTFFRDRQDLAAQITAFVEATSGERRWRRAG